MFSRAHTSAFESDLQHYHRDMPVNDILDFSVFRYTCLQCAVRKIIKWIRDASKNVFASNVVSKAWYKLVPSCLILRIRFRLNHPTALMLLDNTPSCYRHDYTHACGVSKTQMRPTYHRGTRAREHGAASLRPLHSSQCPTRRTLSVQTPTSKT